MKNLDDLEAIELYFGNTKYVFHLRGAEIPEKENTHEITKSEFEKLFEFCEFGCEKDFGIRELQKNLFSVDEFETENLRQKITSEILENLKSFPIREIEKPRSKSEI